MNNLENALSIIEEIILNAKKNTFISIAEKEVRNNITFDSLIDSLQNIDLSDEYQTMLKLNQFKYNVLGILK